MAQAIRRSIFALAVTSSWLAPELRAQCPGWSQGFAPPSGGDGMNARIYDLVTFAPFPGAGRELIAGGNFTAAGTAATPDQVASWNGSTWTNIGSGCGTNGEVGALTTYEVPPGGFGIATPFNELYAGGGFTAIDCVLRTTSRCGPSGRGFRCSTRAPAWTAPTATSTRSRPTTSTAVGRCRRCSSSGDSSASPVASLPTTSPSGPNTWVPLGTCSASGGGVSGGIIPGRVDALCVFNDGSGAGPELYAGGYFTSIDSGTCAAPASLVAKWNPWSNTWTAIGALTGSNVYDLVVLDDDGASGTNPPALFAGGDFGAIGGSNVAKWNGVTWNSVGVGFNDVVRDLCSTSAVAPSAWSPAATAGSGQYHGQPVASSTARAGSRSARA